MSLTILIYFLIIIVEMKNIQGQRVNLKVNFFDSHLITKMSISGCVFNRS